MEKCDWEGLGTIEEHGCQMTWALHMISDLDKLPESRVTDRALSPILADVTDNYP